ncbi:MAG: hypothetical protein M3O36_13080 [Myxococcota bacterium]|nr:hypothetical protein [Myxococcota bacterium]
MRFSSDQGGGLSAAPRRLLALLFIPAAFGVSGALLALRVHFQPPTVPRYALEPESQTVPPHGGHFEVAIRPSGHVDGAIAVRAFLLRGDQVRPWDPPFHVERDGSARIAGSVESLFAGVPPGDWEVAVAVGRPETLPTAPKTILQARDEALSGARDAAWRLVRGRVRLEESAGDGSDRDR